MHHLLILAAALAAPSASAIDTASIDADVAAVVQHEHLPGLAMAVVEDGRVVYRHAEGARGDGGRIDEDTLFRIASNSKAMTAALLARLVQQGTLRWDDPVQRHLPGFRMHDAWVGEQMQVRDLLIHNSGLGLGAGDLMLWPEPNTFTRADIIAGLAHLKPVSSFRSHYAYDNLMYVVAGEVAAAAGGKPYDQLMREQVFEPLGMARCQVGAWSVKRVGNVAQPHTWRDDRHEVMNADGAISPDLTSMAAGGIRCSLRDMTRWMQVLLDPALVPGWLGSEQRRTLWTLHMPMPLGERQRRWDNAHFYGYGYGWRVSDMDGQWKVAHTGTLSGMYSSLALLPDRKVGVMMLINGEGEDARTALMQAALKRFTTPDDARPAMEYLAELKADQATRAATGHSRPSTVAAQVTSRTDLSRWQGRYRDPWLGPASLCQGADGLRFSVDKSPKLQAAVLQLQGRWLLRWDTLGEDAQAWLQPGDGAPPTLDLRAIDPDIDFSYDFQDLHFTRTGDCAGSERQRR
ncbi:serine hydrolase [Stenotrophomonas maltophilia]|uniref:serine hydrolase domain-containing protein n=1 Tax=Stenotrophomonas TaxID=40323 RepID=UPI00063F804A|nr:MULTISPECIES: serine hydrolase domain-containing protein [Stenotrophomonas]ELC7323562.1 serine hydrolase [Stenotrophomonas maltophilia]MBA0277268.1 serine hydrolase [Stenotrophomonas maltophilia]MBA0412632.1 serine hydrolase [Stenotrophomonas maltophilia]MBA0497997.1 serine hydrolase [Stenotrophomonas maltophilia]MBA0503126.1 serine hydrolase [Stenotrophomonas maltophilia]